MLGGQRDAVHVWGEVVLIGSAEWWGVAGGSCIGEFTSAGSNALPLNAPIP